MDRRSRTARGAYTNLMRAGMIGTLLPLVRLLPLGLDRVLLSPHRWREAPLRSPRIDQNAKLRSGEPHPPASPDPRPARLLRAPIVSSPCLTWKQCITAIMISDNRLSCGRTLSASPSPASTNLAAERR